MKSLFEELGGTYTLGKGSIAIRDASLKDEVHV